MSCTQGIDTDGFNSRIMEMDIMPTEIRGLWLENRRILGILLDRHLEDE
ncbi:hypothetical protein IQ267_20065 [filamentous cyanobacterium LEGE 07170]|nr:hypothetical protein [filamentous cyanobacterium LEGE 07170]